MGFDSSVNTQISNQSSEGLKKTEQDKCTHQLCSKCLSHLLTIILSMPQGIHQARQQHKIIEILSKFNKERDRVYQTDTKQTKECFERHSLKQDCCGIQSNYKDFKMTNNKLSSQTINHQYQDLSFKGRGALQDQCLFNTNHHKKSFNIITIEQDSKNLVSQGSFISIEQDEMFQSMLEIIHQPKMESKLSRLCLVACVDSGRVSSAATAYYLDHQHILTAWHVVSDHQAAYPNLGVLFPDRDPEGSDKCLIQELSSSIMPIKYTDHMFSGILRKDVRVIRLQRTLGHHVPKNTFADFTDESVRNRTKSLSLLGYPKANVDYSHSKRQVIEKNCPMIELSTTRWAYNQTEQAIVYEMATQAGHSGAPVFATLINEQGHEQQALVGIHLQGKTTNTKTLGYGLAFSKEHIDYLTHIVE